MKYKSFLIFNGAMLLFLLAMLLTYPIDVLREYRIKNYPSAYEYAEPLSVYGDAYVKQTFTVSDKSNTFNFRTDVANENYYGSFTVYLLNDSGKSIGKWDVDKLDAGDGWVECRLPKGYMLPEKTYSIQVTAPELKEQTAIKLGLGYSSANAKGVGALAYKPAWVNTEKDHSDYSMSFGVYRHRTNVFGISALIILLITANIWLVLKDKGIEAAALPIILGMGLVMLVSFPFGLGMDERYHFFSSYELSNVIMGHDNTSTVENKHLIDNELFRNEITNDLYIKVLNEFPKGHPADTGVTDYLDYKNDLTQPVSHLAQAIGVTLGRILNLNVYQIYWLARLFNLLSYVFMIMIAVKLVPVNKELMVMLGINPMVLREATSTGYDAPVIGLSYILIAYIMKLMYDGDKILWKDILICAILAMLMSPIKVIYVLLSFLILAIPGKQFKSVWDRLIKSIAVIEGGFLSVWLSRRRALLAVMGASVATAGPDEQVQPLKYTWRFVFDHPLRFIKLLLSNIVQSLDSSMYGIFGEEIGVPKYMILGFILIILLCALSAEAVAVTDRFSRFIFIGIAIAGYFTIFFVFMMAETVYGKNVIAGWQSRYFVPFIPLLMFCLCGLKGSFKIDRKSLFMPFWFVEILLILGIYKDLIY
ncbi:MAG: DUF2142 domain-containing protein [Lachnospiraceae bacterium]|nr:DUF2142 domain-containing protein [Lachnospiraceae bacterium]